ncbi:MAG TPA: PRC-barrel domain-containing protein, partial [Caulobacteraceae bacterium]
AIKDLYLDKTSGTVEFAALAFGGLLGVGVKYHPLPWQELDYDTTKGGFVVEIDKADLERSPAYEADRLAGNETAWRNEVRTYYADLPGERPGPAI